MTHWKSWEQNIFSQFSWGFLYFPQFLRFSDRVVVEVCEHAHELLGRLIYLFSELLVGCTNFEFGWGMESNGSAVSYPFEHSGILSNQVHTVCTVQLLLQRKKERSILDIIFFSPQLNNAFVTFMALCDLLTVSLGFSVETQAQLWQASAKVLWVCLF